MPKVTAQYKRDVIQAVGNALAAPPPYDRDAERCVLGIWLIAGECEQSERAMVTISQLTPAHFWCWPYEMLAGSLIRAADVGMRRTRPMWWLEWFEYDRTCQVLGGLRYWRLAELVEGWYFPEYAKWYARRLESAHAGRELYWRGYELLRDALASVGTMPGDGA